MSLSTCNVAPIHNLYIYTIFLVPQSHHLSFTLMQCSHHNYFLYIHAITPSFLYIRAVLSHHLSFTYAVLSHHLSFTFINAITPSFLYIPAALSHHISFTCLQYYHITFPLHVRKSLYMPTPQSHHRNIQNYNNITTNS